MRIADVSGAEIVAKCNMWIGCEPNKKKRLMDSNSVTDKELTIGEQVKTLISMMI